MPGGKPALGMRPLVGFGRLGEEAAQRGFELGARVVLALRGAEERAAVDQAVDAGRGEVRDVMQELAPLGALGEPERVRARDDLGNVGFVREPAPRGDGQKNRKKTLQRELQGLVAVMQFFLL